MSQKYIRSFLALKCAGDVLNVVTPVQKMEKEITESMSIIKELKKITLKDPMKYNIVDMCAGNALTSVLSVFTLPVKKAIAIDIKARKRRWHLADRFTYWEKDINTYRHELYDVIDENSIIIGVHACGNLSNDIIDIYKKSYAKHLILMPCCQGTLTKKVPLAIQDLIQDKYKVWTWQLAEACDGRFKFDKSVISPKNGVIIASKE